MIKKLLLLIFIGLAIGLTANGACNTPTPANFGYYRQMTINSAYVSTTQTNYVVLASTTNSTLSATSSGGHMQTWNSASSTPNDVAFFANDKTTPLNFEIERYSSTTGELIAWVRVPDGVSTSTNINFYVYYGYSGGIGYQCATSTWGLATGTDPVSVWHLNWPISTPASSTYDSTLNHNTGTMTNMAATTSVAGKIDGGTGFDGANDYVDAGKGSSLLITNQFTYSAWVKPMGTGSNVDQYGSVILVKGGGVNNFAVFISAYNNTTKQFWISVKLANSNNPNFYSNYLFTEGQWCYLTITYNHDNVCLYVNGVYDSFDGLGKQNSNIADNITKPLYIGKWDFSGYVRAFNGVIDNVQIYNTALSTSTIATDYNMENSNSTFLSWGDETSTVVKVCTPVYLGKFWFFKKGVTLK